MMVWLSALRYALPSPRGQRSDPGDLRHLLRFGGWLSISNLVGPLMVYADRFYLASLFSPAAVAYYTVPYDVLLRVTSIPATAIGAVFPALAEAQVRPADSALLVNTTAAALVALLLPPLLMVAIFAKVLLVLWLGRTFALSALPIFQVLLLGAFINSAAYAPYALLQAHGRSDLTAKLHLLELPIFVGMLVSFVSLWGLVGAALAWTLRVALDAGALYGCAMRLLPECRRGVIQSLGLIVLAVGALLAPLVSDNRLLLTLIVLLALVLCVAVLMRLYQRRHRPSLLVT